jgi:cobalt-zinc-cadmium resistance protein CzcA
MGTEATRPLPESGAHFVPERRSRLQRWFDWMLPRKGRVLALGLLWGLGGLLAFLNLKRDLFPDLSLPTLSLLIQSPGRAATELELSVAQPVEQAMGGLPGVRRVNSQVYPELVQIIVAFEGDADPWRARQLVSERLSSLQSAFPAGTRPPLVTSASGRLHELMELVLEGEHVDPMRLRDQAEQVVVPRLQAVPGVARIERMGGEERSIQITLLPERMRSLGVGLEALRAALEDSHQDQAAGVLEIQDKSWFLTVASLAGGSEAVRALPVKGARGWCTVGELAEVREAPAFRRGLARHQGHEDVSLRVVKQPGAESLAVSAGVRAALAELRKGLPEGMRLELIYDQGEMVSRALDGVTRALLLGGFFVALVLVLLLGSLRGALLVLVVLPLSTFGAAIPLQMAGLSLNAMTLGGLAIAVGLQVDAAVIMVENLAHRLHAHAGEGEGESRRMALTRAAAEVAAPILTAILVILAVFIPLLALGGLAGRLYAPLALAVASAMSLSLACTFTVVPALVERFLPPELALEEPAPVRAIKRVYRPALDWALAHGAWVRILALGVTVPSIWLALRLGSNFLPALDEGAFMLLSKLPSATSLEAVDQANLRLDLELKAVKGVQAVYRRSGRGEVTEDPCPVTDSEILVVLEPNADPRAVGRELAEVAEHMPFPVDLNTPMQERIAEGIGGTPADIQVKLFHADLEALREFLPRLQERLARLPGVRSVSPDTGDPMPSWRVVPDDEALRRLGVPRSLLVPALQAALQGLDTEPRFIGPQRIERVLRFPADGHASPETLKRLPLVLEEGRVVELGQVARFEESRTPSVIRREGAQRRMGLNLRTMGDLGGTADRVERELARLELPKGTSVRMGGKVEEARETNRRLVLAVLVSFVLVLGLLYATLRCWKEVLVVIATLPDAFAGALLALWLAGETWNISSIVGLIGLFGVAVQNSLVLITQAKALMAVGLPFDQALREASLGRVRPKLMTAGAAILGLLPMLLGIGGSELERPLAIAMVGGLVTSTLFTLLALPSFYAWIGKPRRADS